VTDPTTEASIGATKEETVTSTTVHLTATGNYVATCCCVQYNGVHILWSCPIFVSYVQTAEHVFVLFSSIDYCLPINTAKLLHHNMDVKAAPNTIECDGIDRGHMLSGTGCTRLMPYLLLATELQRHLLQCQTADNFATTSIAKHLAKVTFNISDWCGLVIGKLESFAGFQMQHLQTFTVCCVHD